MSDEKIAAGLTFAAKPRSVISQCTALIDQMCVGVQYIPCICCNMNYLAIEEIDGKMTVTVITPSELYNPDSWYYKPLYSFFSFLGVLMWYSISGAMNPLTQKYQLSFAAQRVPSAQGHETQMIM